MSVEFVLDERLAADSLPICELPLSSLRLMDDARYTWLILVPRVAGARELVDLDIAAQHVLLDEVNRACHVLRALVRPDKLNVAALGNVVAQLHVHVIARHIDDAAWPRPVWGDGVREPYAADAAQARIAQLRAALEG